MNHDQTDTGAAVFKLFVAWCLTVFSNITLQHVATFCAIVYTLLQIYILVRDKIVSRK